MVDIPVDLTDDLVRTTITLHLFSVRLFPHFVEILVQLVQEIVEELLTILVIEPPELMIDNSQHHQQLLRRNRSPTTIQVILHKFTISTSKVAFRTQHVVHI